MTGSFDADVLIVIRDELRAKVTPEASSEEARGTCAMIDYLITRSIIDSADRQIADAYFLEQYKFTQDAIEITNELGVLETGDRLPADVLPEAFNEQARQRTVAVLDKLVQKLLNIQTDAATKHRITQLTANILSSNLKRLEAREAATIKHSPGAADAKQLSSLEINADRFQNYLRARFAARPNILVTSMRALSGGFSKSTLLFDVSGMEEMPTSLVLRVDLPNGVTGTTVIDEYPILNAMYKVGIPVPEPLWLESNPELLGATFMAMRRVPGGPAGPIGSADLTVCTPETARDLARTLAKLHTLDVGALSLGGVWAKATTPREAVLTMIETFQTMYYARRLEPDPMMEIALQWLKSNIPPAPSRVAIVHSDLGFPNILVDKGKVTAILDWELSYPGDAAEDLSYIRPYIEQLLDWNEFTAIYEAEGGARFPEESAQFYDVWRTVRNAIYAVTCLDAFSKEPARYGVAYAFAGLMYYDKHMKYVMGKILPRLQKQ